MCAKYCWWMVVGKQWKDGGTDPLNSKPGLGRELARAETRM